MTGLLAYDGDRFVQVLEGSPESVTDAFSRIREDPRHRDVRVISDTIEAERVFGE